MSGNTARLEAIATINSYEPIATQFDYINEPTVSVFGENIFGLEKMKQYLPKEIYKSIKVTIDEGTALDPTVADVVASAMKKWALSRGATHYAHVFFPLTGYTAEKHDSFLNPTGETGGAIAEFSGAQLIQGEPDASSFPNGGIRPTSQARGYTVWDITSPAYLQENANGVTLTIPTGFVSWTGESLDMKTPVLRSMQALDKQARRVLKLFGHKEIAKVSATAGPEQEYFLVDNNFYFARPDLLSTGRTLFGAPSAKGQQFADQYFGRIPDRVQAFMLEAEREMAKLGIPIKTRHNEVAPAQYEIAPVFETANVATDHQQLIMATLKSVAHKYGMTALLHEKPFAGLNGSGKHMNFSLGNSTQGNLLDPGDTPHDNAQFLVFCSAVIRSVYKHSKLLRTAVASAGNDHRLGANEAPPAIISIFLGDQLTDVFEQIKAGGAKTSKSKGSMAVGVDVLPIMPKDAGDRNRTSPFAFTGNRFEYRAVGGNQSLGLPLAVVNSIVAESLDYIATQLERETGGDDSKLNAAVQKILKDVITEAWPIVFNGDNYSEAWHEEAAKRGLPNLKTTAQCLPVLTEKETIELFDKYEVMNETEIKIRQEVSAELYANTVNVEADLTLEMARTLIFPAAIRYQSELASAVNNVKSAGSDVDTDTLDKVTGLIRSLQNSCKDLDKVQSEQPEEALALVSYLCTKTLPAMLAIRSAVDELENIVADDLWPLPTYQEMLFIR